MQNMIRPMNSIVIRKSRTYDSYGIFVTVYDEGMRIDMQASGENVAKIARKLGITFIEIVYVNPETIPAELKDNPYKDDGFTLSQAVDYATDITNQLALMSVDRDGKMKRGRKPAQIDIIITSSYDGVDIWHNGQWIRPE